MSDIERTTAAYYDKPDLGRTILEGLRQAGKEPDALTPEDLAPVDAFHIRGRAATAELAAHCRPGPGHEVLDVGCGLGGTARYLAAQYGCRATGLDLTPSYVDAAALLSDRVGLSDRVAFRSGSALAMPFADGAFDLAWTEHAQMNVPDKRGFCGEIHRVLKPGGRFAFHDIFQGPGGPPHFPTPWATEPSYSALIAAEDYRALLESLGYRVTLWEDRTAEGRDWFRERVAAMQKQQTPPPLGFHLLIGPVAREAQANILRNLEEERVTLVQGVAEKAA